MLRPAGAQASPDFVNFGAITPNSSGKGIAYCYNAVAKKTQAGKPFITMYLRDHNGIAIPGYVFDLSRPLFAGKDLNAAIGSPVLIEWQENYLRNVGLTVIVDSAAIVHDLPSKDLEMFTGAIADLKKKEEELNQFFTRELQINISLPFWISSHSSLEHCQGKVGGVCEHYWRMKNQLECMKHVGAEEYRRLVGTFVIYTFVHANYLRLSEAGSADIRAVSSLTEKVNALNAKLKLGPGILEVVHMFFGYEPMDVYVRTIASLSEQVSKVDREFALYKTIPLTQEGDAGYGKIRRYEIEGANT